MGTINRYFSREFKVNAVQLVTEKKMTVRQVAEELDIHPTLLSIWKGKYLKLERKHLKAKDGYRLNRRKSENCEKNWKR